MNLGREIRYIDFHTHRGAGGADRVAIRNIMSGEEIPEDFAANTLFSAGIHPWKLTSDNLRWLKTELILSVAHPHVLMIGEAGFDRLKGPSWAIQNEAFIFQAVMAEEMHKPMIIHCVRGWEELLRARRELKPATTWVIHGFKGKQSLAATLAEEGFWFSLGFHGLKKEILDTVSHRIILLETDDSRVSIEDVYGRFSEEAQYDLNTASDLIRNNFNNLFKG
jgi:TatD DNase family protein